MKICTAVDSVPACWKTARTDYYAAIENIEAATGPIPYLRAKETLAVLTAIFGYCGPDPPFQQA
jgi:hypothetical protein